MSITDDTRPMGRFMQRRGGETLYMCYIEAEEIAPIVRKLDAKGMRYAGREPQSPNPEGIFLHPRTRLRLQSRVVLQSHAQAIGQVAEIEGQVVNVVRRARRFKDKIHHPLQDLAGGPGCSLGPAAQPYVDVEIALFRKVAHPVSEPGSEGGDRGIGSRNHLSAFSL